MNRYRIVPLEERILLDAALAHDVVSAATHGGEAAVQHYAHVLLVANTVPDVAALDNAAKHNTLVINYDPNTTSLDALRAEIKQALGGQKVQSIGIVNDGSPGEFQITSNEILNIDSFQQGHTDKEMVQFWQGLTRFLKPDGHVDLLGCQVADGVIGQDLLNSVTQVLNSNGSHFTVYASTNDTGNPSLGGDWILESPHPLNAGALYFNQTALAQWDYILPVVRDFSVRFSDTINGDITMTANSILQAPTGSHVTSTSDNNDFNMTYVNISNASGIFDSSSGTLQLPPGSQVVFAGLYWGGNLSGGSGGHGALDPQDLNQVLLQAPGSSHFITINGSIPADTTDSGGNGIQYQGFANVTSLVQQAGAGVYTIANLQAGTGANADAGWALVIAYQNSSLPLHNLTIYDGFVNITGSSSTTVQLTGFQTPTSGPVDTHVGVVAYEGDAGLTGDSLTINNGTSSGQLSDALNPANNFFNSTLSTNGVYNTLQNPDVTNQLGFDAKIVDASNLFVNNEQSANVTFSTTGDQYLPGVLTFSTTINEAQVEPSINAIDLTSHPNGFIHAGDIVQYTITVENDGTGTASNVSLNDVIPSNTTYIPDSLAIVSGANAGAKTDAGGDDQAQISGNNITFFLGTGANGTQGGTLLHGDKTVISFEVQVNPNTQNNTYIYDTATTNFINQDVNVPSTLSDTISFQAKNDVPVGTASTYTTLEDSTLIVPASNGLLTYVTDTENNAVTVFVPSGQGPTHGTLILNPDGSFTYTPTANYNGTDSFSYEAQDSAGGISKPILVTLDVTAVNQAPSFTVGSDQTVLEDSSAQTVNNFATNISPGPSNESSQVVNFIVSNNNNALFSVQPTISADGTLNYTLAPDAVGSATVSVQIHDNGGTSNGGIDTSAIQTFAIDVTPVNQAPSFAVGSDQTVLENSSAQTVNNFASNISPGPPNESSQVVDFIVSNNNNALFSVQPTISANGTLNYTLAPDANGTATVSVQIHDNGGTSNGGVDTSAIQTFAIDVTPVNQAPSFAVGSDQTVLENSSAQTVNNFASNISAGPPNESSQVVDFIVSNNNNSLFSVQPTISANGTLTYTLAPDANGTATVSVQIHDNGGTSNGGVDTSAVQTFAIDVNPVNQAPSFAVGSNQTVLENSSAQTVNNFASNISAGPSNESSQVVDFIVSNNNNALFSVQPTISANGTLTYTLAPDANGTATVSVQIHDNGGTSNGGVDTSAVQTFAINATPVNQAPSFTVGSDQTVLENSSAQTVNNFASNISAGPPNESSQVVDFIVSNNNNALFSVQPTISANGTLTYTLAPDANGTATVSVQIHDNGGTSNGGVDTNVAQNFTIHVTPTATASAPAVSQPAPEPAGQNSGTGTGTSTASTAASPASAAFAYHPQTHEAPLSQTSSTSDIYIEKANINLSGQYAYDSYSVNTNYNYTPMTIPTLNIEASHSSYVGLTLTERKGSEFIENPFVEVQTTHFVAPHLNAPPHTVVALVSATAITDISYPGLNRRGGVVLPIRFDLAGVVITPSDPPVTSKGNELELQVTLNSMPTAKVIVSFKTSNAELAVVTPSRLEFTFSNWNIPQTINVKGLGGSQGYVNAEGLVIGGSKYDLIVLPMESSDGNYRDLAADPIPLWAIEKAAA